MSPRLVLDNLADRQDSRSAKLLVATLQVIQADTQTFAVDAVKLAQIMIVIQNNISTEEDPRTAFLIDGELCLSVQH